MDRGDVEFAMHNALKEFEGCQAMVKLDARVATYYIRGHLNESDGVFEVANDDIGMSFAVHAIEKFIIEQPRSKNITPPPVKVTVIIDALYTKEVR